MAIKSFIKATLANNYYTSRPDFSTDCRVEAVKALAGYTKGKKIDDQIGFDTTNSAIIGMVRCLELNGASGCKAVTCLDLSYVRFTKRAVENLAKAVWQKHYEASKGLWCGEKIETLGEWVELMTA